ncbi:RNA-binding domain-containing protein [Clostridium sp. BJN0001]|uniref:AlbA family DNA-binding domain-containing protein n=1 Tax=Clostridium sp. BJN0001 TaxID=2930219 RepID=UPI001FD00090|nr:RNA-binding domain-containing protein [Clostridium sp. BJN0001]
MNIKKLKLLIKGDEGVKLDFKQQLELSSETGKKELTKDICAIANSNGGRGYLVIGVEDKTKKIIGLDDENMFKEEQVQQIITSRCEPPIPIKVDFVNYKEKVIGVITIFDAQQRPYQVRDNGAFYIRRGSTTDVMRKQELISLLESELSLTIETCPVIQSDIKMLNMDIVKKYFQKKDIELNEKNEKFLLVSAGIISKQRETCEYKCTYGGLLVFSDENYLSIPNNIIKIVYSNNGKSEVAVIQGSLLSMIEKCMDTLKKILPSDYPITSVLEAIKNAVLYREYFALNRIIEVFISDDDIIVTSPGEFINQNINGEKTNYSRRNIWLYEKMITLDDGKGFLNNGNGLKRIKNSFKGRRVKFINSRVEHSFKVILPGTKYKLRGDI